MITITPEYLASQHLSPTFPERFWAKVDKNGPIPAICPERGPCWRWLGAKDSRGYGMIVGMYLGNGKNFLIRAHVAICILNGNPPSPGYEICHHCDFPECSNPAHLFEDTHERNMQDMARKGRANTHCPWSVGSNNGHSKLSESDVIEIRRMFELGQSTMTDIAKVFGIDRTQVAHIVKRQQWCHLK